MFTQKDQMWHFGEGKSSKYDECHKNILIVVDFSGQS